MKKFFITLTALLLTASISMAQAPNKFSYQSVVRNSSGAILANSQVGVKISILKTNATGAVQYAERHTPTTNANGLVDLQIGGGTLISGNFANINWTNDAYFIKTEVDPTGGSAYTISGTNQMLSVPYAMNAGSVKVLNSSANGDDGKIVNGNFSPGLNILGIGTLGNASDRKTTMFGNLTVVDANPSVTIGTLANGTGGGGAVWLGNSNHGIKRTGNDVTIQTAGEGDLIFTNGFTLTERMRITDIGNVGIGTPNPTAKLHINGGASRGSGTGFAFYALDNFLRLAVTGYAPPATVTASIFATDRIIGNEFNAMSDARMKRVIGQSNSSKDLSLINKVKITDYTHIDAAKTQGPIKKVIAQELEQVYPQAVSKTTNVVPDIYSIAGVEGEWLMVKNNLSKGEKVRIIQGDESTIMDVTEANAKGFKVKGKLTDKQVFVYGREVEDFRVVDYEALSTLNISATQELAKKVAALETENAALKAENKEVKTSLNTFQSQIEAINAKLEALAPAETARK